MNSEKNHNNEGRKAKDAEALVAFYYNRPEDLEAKEILLEHSRAVARLALEINERRNLGLDREMIEYAAMVHDIGIIRTYAPGIGCHGTLPYICHGTEGADMLRKAGCPEWAARVAERHTGAGLTADDIHEQNLPLPADRILIPETLLEKLICYADKFFSKKPGQLSVRKSTDRVRNELARHGAPTLERFDALHALFS